MSEQLRLFEPDLTSWVERIWTKVDAELRGEIVSVLAQMGRRALEQRQGPAKEGTTDES